MLGSENGNDDEDIEIEEAYPATSIKAVYHHGHHHHEAGKRHGTIMHGIDRTG